MLSSDNPVKKKYDEEQQELVAGELPNDNSNQFSNPGLLLKCMQSNSYCLSLMDYLKKLMYFSQIDFHSAYLQILFCFQPNEINEVARIRKRKLL